MLLTQNLCVPRMSDQKPESLPEQTVAYLGADKILRTSDVVKRWTFKTMLYDYIYNHDKHSDIWHEGLAIFMYEIAALKSKGEAYRARQTIMQDCLPRPIYCKIAVYCFP